MEQIVDIAISPTFDDANWTHALKHSTNGRWIRCDSSYLKRTHKILSQDLIKRTMVIIPIGYVPINKNRFDLIL